MSDQESNRSSALTPEQLGQMNVQAAAMIKEAVTAVFASLAPALASMALTPEKLREMNKPYVDPAREARDARETLLWRQDMETQRQQTQAHQDNCLHIDDNQRSSIRIIRNCPDRQPRGICVHCLALITPKEWRIGPPDAENPRGRAYLAEPHKNYQTVLQIAARE
jgi:hypothetical protein